MEDVVARVLSAAEGRLHVVEQSDKECDGICDKAFHDKTCF